MGVVDVPDVPVVVPIEFTVRLTDVTEEADGTIRGTCDPKALEEAARASIQRVADERGPIVIGAGVPVMSWPEALERCPELADHPAVKAPDSDEDPL